MPFYNKKYYVYILASKINGTLYVGMTRHLIQRVEEHKSDMNEGFTKQYQVHDLVHWEEYSKPSMAIQREKNIKAWKRAWKINLIQENNPTWKDLYYELV